MEKTGNTPFVFEQLNITMEGALFFPLREINELRRCALEQLEKSLLARARRCDAKEHIQKKDEGYCGTKERIIQNGSNSAEKYSDRKENKTVTGFSYSVAVMTGKQLEAVLG